jgi:2-oxoisovalerate dehydrogenase E2 component (dihydrolipoyl transacylase)
VVKVGQPICDVDVEAEIGGEEDATQEETVPPTAGSSVEEGSTVQVDKVPTSRPHPLRDGGTTPRLDPSEKSNVLATPAVRRIAREEAVRLADVNGTGKDGRITKEDILGFVKARSSPAASPTRPVETSTTEEVKTPLTGNRRAMYRSMAASLEIPHFAYSDEIDVTELERVRRLLNEDIPARYRKTPAPGTNEASDRVDEAARFDRLTLLPLLVKVLSRSMRDHPIFASSLVQGPDDSGQGQQPYLLRRATHDISIALSPPSGGLYTPVLSGVESASPFAIASQIAALQTIARASSPPRFPPALLRPGTITLSNVGVIGGTYTHPVIPPTGQLAIGALGRTRVLPRYADEDAAGQAALSGDGIEVLKLKPRLVMSVSFTADHRVVEGVELARLVEEWKKRVERPGLMLGEAV